MTALSPDIKLKTHYTDNAFVCHCFCKPFLLPRQCYVNLLSRDTRICPQSKFCKVTNSCLCPQLYRDTAPVCILRVPVSWKVISHLERLYRETRIRPKICTMTPKTAPCFAHSIWCRDVTPIRLHCSSLHSLSNTNALYCRAVSSHVEAIRRLLT